MFYIEKKNKIIYNIINEEKGEGTMSEQFSRTQSLLGDIAFEKLKGTHIAVFGVGGVGSFAAEALVRSGVSKIDLIDADTVSVTNINRQNIALLSTVGKNKVDVAKERYLDINPDAEINTFPVFFDESTKNTFDFSKYDYVIDAIDSVSSKILLIECAKSTNTPIISSMGAGNKLFPEMFEISDIFKTSVCPLARVMRCELKKRGIKHLKVVYSKEPPVKACAPGEPRVPASISFVPSAAGLIIAGEVVRDIIK